MYFTGKGTEKKARK